MTHPHLATCGLSPCFIKWRCCAGLPVVAACVFQFPQVLAPHWRAHPWVCSRLAHVLEIAPHTHDALCCHAGLSSAAPLFAQKVSLESPARPRIYIQSRAGFVAQGSGPGYSQEVSFTGPGIMAVCMFVEDGNLMSLVPAPTEQALWGGAMAPSTWLLGGLSLGKCAAETADRVARAKTSAQVLKDRHSVVVVQHVYRPAAGSSSLPALPPLAGPSIPPSPPSDPHPPLPGYPRAARRITR